MDDASREFRNPVIKGFHPDPSICRVRDTFYLVVSSFEYFPGIPIFQSSDLVEWTQIGHVLTRTSQLDLIGAPSSGGIFAPTIRHHAGRFYVTSTLATDAGNGGHFIVTTTDPAGAWSDPVWVDQCGIDPSLYFESGLVYFTSNIEPNAVGPHIADAGFRRGIQQSLIDPITGSVIRTAEYIWGGSGARFPEAPHLYRRGGFYYLLTAEGGTEYGHISAVGRSRSPWGPFERSPHGPVIDQRSAPSPLQAVGHADLVELADGTWWAVCLGVRPVGHWPRHLLGRETLLTRIEWTQDGWPLANGTGRVEAVGERPHLAPTDATAAGFRDDFDSPRLDHRWEFVRVPLDQHDLLGSRAGSLSLRADGRSINGRFPCFVGRRQEDYHFSASSLLDADEQADGDESGVAVRVNERHIFRIGVVGGSASTRQLVVHQTAGSVETIDVLGDIDPGPVLLAVTGTPDSYTFTARTSTGALYESARLESRFLSTEFVGGFTGTFIGLYAHTAADSTAAVHFDWFDYRPLEPTDPAPPGAAASLAAVDS